MLSNGVPDICNNHDDVTCQHVVRVIGVRDYYHIMCKKYHRKIQNIWNTSTYATVYYDMNLVDAIYRACWQTYISVYTPSMYLFDAHMPNGPIKCLVYFLKFFDDTYTWKKSGDPFHFQSYCIPKKYSWFSLPRANGRIKSQWVSTMQFSDQLTDALGHENLGLVYHPVVKSRRWVDSIFTFNQMIKHWIRSIWGQWKKHRLNHKIAGIR